MSTAIALPGNSDRTFLTHLLARGLENERDVVERQAMGDGDIRRWPGRQEDGHGAAQGEAHHGLVEGNPGAALAHNEIIVCTGLRIRCSGIQYWCSGNATLSPHSPSDRSI